MGKSFNDLLQRDQVVLDLHTDLYLARWQLERVREMYIKQLGGQWLCEGCGEMQPASANSIAAYGGSVHLCRACFRVVIEDAKRSYLDAKEKTRLAARKGRVQ